MHQRHNRMPEKNSGVYVIWLYLHEDRIVKVGCLGEFLFERGVYAYCGSAQRHLESRIKRHQRLTKPLHWHIDYLRAHSEFLGHNIFRGWPKKGECDLTKKILSMENTCLPVRGFGASDCSCVSHLVYVGREKSIVRYNDGQTRIGEGSFFSGYC